MCQFYVSFDFLKRITYKRPFVKWQIVFLSLLEAELTQINGCPVRNGRRRKEQKKTLLFVVSPSHCASSLSLPLLPRCDAEFAVNLCRNAIISSEKMRCLRKTLSIKEPSSNKPTDVSAECLSLRQFFGQCVKMCVV